MLSMLYARLTIKVKAGIPESFKVGWYRHKITGSTGRCWKNESVLTHVKFDHQTAKREWQNISVLNPYLVIDFGKFSFV